MGNVQTESGVPITGENAAVEFELLAGRKAAAVARTVYDLTLARITRQSESEIERAFAAAMVFLEVDPVTSLGISFMEGEFRLEKSKYERDGIYMWSQASLGPFRADFLIDIHREKTVSRLVIECDGHRFHNETRDQVSHDRARDRWMALNELQVLRFPGSDIWNNPIRCALETNNFIQVTIQKMKGDRHA